MHALIFYYHLTFWAVPSPSVTITSVPLSPVRPVGSAASVTCTMEFNTMVDIPLTVTTEWIGPSGIMVTDSTSTEQPAVGNSTIYTSTATISSFGRNESGLYTCKATSSSASLNPFIRDSTASSSTRVTVGNNNYCCRLH